MKKIIILSCLFAVMIIGCGKSDVAKIYEKSEQNGILDSYCQMKDGTWKQGDNTYKFRLELTGRLPNAKFDTFYVVLTNNSDLSFEDVSKSLYSSSIEDKKIMENCSIVEMK